MLVSILYKYHISLMKVNTSSIFLNATLKCRSFISIIFPEYMELLHGNSQPVSILYKYHISRTTSFLGRSTLYRVSILYKYHISPCKYSTFLTFIKQNDINQRFFAYFFRPSHVFRLFLVLKIAHFR